MLWNQPPYSLVSIPLDVSGFLVFYEQIFIFFSSPDSLSMFIVHHLIAPESTPQVRYRCIFSGMMVMMVNMLPYRIYRD